MIIKQLLTSGTMQKLYLSPFEKEWKKAQHKRILSTNEGRTTTTSESITITTHLFVCLLVCLSAIDIYFSHPICLCMHALVCEILSPVSAQTSQWTLSITSLFCVWLQSTMEFSLLSVDDL